MLLKPRMGAGALWTDAHLSGAAACHTAVNAGRLTLHGAYVRGTSPWAHLGKGRQRQAIWNVTEPSKARQPSNQNATEALEEPRSVSQNGRQAICLTPGRKVGCWQTGGNTEQVKVTKKWLPKTNTGPNSTLKRKQITELVTISCLLDKL